MAYVAPNGTIQLFRSVELTPAYTDTIWFPNISTQDSVFTAQVDYQFTNQMYTRVSGNKVRVHKVADDIRDCSYMRFQNIRNNKAKWFYAFILNVEYINEQVSEITYEIDEIQSWYFESNSYNHFSKCFIERQHSTTDNVGENLVPEPLNVTENIVCHKEFNWTAGQTYYLLVIGLSSLNEAINQFNKDEYGGLASTVEYLLFTSSTAMSKFIKGCNFSNGLVKGLFGANDFWSLIAIYAVPSEFFYYATSAGNTITFFSGTTHEVTGYYMLGYATVQNKNATKPSISGDANHSKHGNSVNGTYTPKNNKMFTYPFSFFRIATPISEQDFKYENFFNASLQNEIQFRLKTCCNPEPTLLVTPIYYNGDENDYRFSLSVASFPRLTIFQSTQTGEIVGKAMKNTAKAIVAIASAAYGGSVGAIADTSSLIQGSNTPPLLASASPAISSGGTNDLAPQFAATGLPAASDITFEIDGYRMGLRKETAELFDNFFSRYGYAQNNVAVPNVHARTKWTYVKTRDCRCTVNAPASSLRKINDIMNNGITWWDYQTSVGNYGDFTNAVIGVG